jgi:DNA-binding CsgD family transcriptional regulator
VFLGREAELAEVAAALSEPGLVVLAGGPGMGKSALARAAVQRSGRAPVAVGGGLATLRQVPGLPLSQAIRARLPTDDPALAAEAVRARVGAGVLLLDDVHWADRFTLDLLPELARTCRIVATLRTPSPLSTAAAQRLNRAALRWLDLGPLAAEPSAELARAVWAGRGHASQQPTPAELAAVLNRAGGNPLAIRLLAASDEPEAGAVHTIASTLAELPQPARTALAALGLLGRPADPALLGDGVAPLLAAGLVSELPDGRVAAAVRFIAEVAAGVLPGDQRRDLHRRLAELVADDAEAAAHLAAAGEHAAAADRAVLAAAVAPTVGARAELMLLAAAHDPAVRLDAAAAAADAGLDGEVVRLLADGSGRASGTPGGGDTASAASVAAAMDVPVRPLASGAADAAAVRRAVLLAEALARRGEPARAGELLRAVAGRVPPELTTAHATASVVAASGADPEVACALAEYAGAAEPGAPAALVAAYGLALLGAGRPGWERALGAALADPAVGGADRLRLAAALVAGLREACRTAEAAEVAATFAAECAEQRAYGWEVRFRAEVLWATTLRAESPAGRHAALDSAGPDARVREAVALLDRAAPAAARTLLAATVGLAHADSGATAAARRALRRGPGRLTRWVAAETAWLAGGTADASSIAAALTTRDGATDLAADLAAVTASWAAADAEQAPPEVMGSARPAVVATLAAWRSGEFAVAARAWAGSVRREQVRCLLATGDKDALLEAEQLAEDAGLTVLLGRVRRALRGLGIVHRAPEVSVSGLSPREYEVLRLVGQGLPTHRIAELIGISRHTAEGYIKQAMGKLGARTRTEAAVLAAALAAALAQPDGPAWGDRR